MDEQTLELLSCRLDKIDLILSLQHKLLEELLDITRSTQLTSAFSVDAINSIFGVLGKMSETDKKLRED